MELFDRVKESCTVTGTGNITLTGAVDTTFKTYASRYLDGVIVPYCIVESGTSFEVGTGTYSAGVITRTAGGVTASSNADNLVSFGSGGKVCFVALSKSLYGVLSKLDVAETRQASIDMAGNVLKAPQLQSESRFIVDHGTISTNQTIILDYAASTEHLITITGSPSLVIQVSNWPASGIDGFLSLQVLQQGTPVVAWQVTASNTDATWLVDGVSPTLTLPKTYFVGFMTKDAGASVFGGHVETL